MNNKLLSIANFIAKDDVVLDIGTDHAYLPIYLMQNNLCKNVIASDINENALHQAKKNIKKANLKIQTILADGFIGVNDISINTVVIAGVGAHTILNIIKNAPSNITKYILSSNNNHYFLRKELVSFGLFVQEEIVVNDNNKYYVIMLVKKNKRKMKRLDLKYGTFNNKDYYNYLLKKEGQLRKKIPAHKLIARFKIWLNIRDLKYIIKRN